MDHANAAFICTYYALLRDTMAQSDDVGHDFIVTTQIPDPAAN